MEEKYVWLSKLQIANKTKFKLLEKFNGIENFYNCSLDDLVNLGLNDNLISKILSKKTREESKQDLEYMIKNNIDIIWYKNKFYPENLKSISDKPICFYIRGNKNILNDEAVGIVGSRKAFQSSLEFAKEISKRLSLKEINIISGLARGVDKFAHLGCLENFNSGKTIAVLGNSIKDEDIYPYENRRVFQRILESNGAIISEYPLNTPAYPYNFPYRNRIISGLSNKLILVQASIKSGSLITVDYALDQGKDIYVLKDKNINHPAFEGNKLLLSQGAIPLEI